jgi:hypothetical protein
MNSNPIVEIQQQLEAQDKANKSYRYPFHIICVYEDSYNNDFPIILEVRDYCNKNNLIFSARQYNFEKYGDDMFIKRLPAFHIYYKKGHQTVEYYDTIPIYKIQTMVWAYQDEMKEKEKRRIHRQERWESFKEELQSIFSFERFKKKPALDPSTSLSHIRDTKE